MFLKREVYDGPKDKAEPVISKLEKAGIKTYLYYPDQGHAADVARGAGVGRYGASGSGNSTVVVCVKLKDYDAAQAALR